MNSKQTLDDEITKIFITIENYGTAQEARNDIKQLIIKERIDEAELSESEIQKRADKVPPNLLLNEVVNYTGERIANLETQLKESER